MTALESTPRAGIVLADDGVATLTVIGEKTLNIIGSPAMVEVIAALGSLAAHPRVRVLVVRGAGERAFIGGADIDEMAGLTAASAPAFITRLRDMCEALRRFPTPVIARLAGWCLGGGLEAAMACDLRIADHDARFGMPEVAVGIPSVIHAALMPHLIGESRAAWLLMTGEAIDAVTAERWGLVHTVCAPAELDGTIARLAGRIAGFGPAVVRQQKALMRSWQQMPVDAAIDASVAQFAGAFESGEPRLYMEAFRTRKRVRR